MVLRESKSTHTSTGQWVLLICVNLIGGYFIVQGIVGHLITTKGPDHPKLTEVQRETLNRPFLVFRELKNQ